MIAAEIGAVDILETLVGAGWSVAAELEAYMRDQDDDLVAVVVERGFDDAAAWLLRSGCWGMDAASGADDHGDEAWADICDADGILDRAIVLGLTKVAMAVVEREWLPANGRRLEAALHACLDLDRLALVRTLAPRVIGGAGDDCSRLVGRLVQGARSAAAAGVLLAAASTATLDPRHQLLADPEVITAARLVPEVLALVLAHAGPLEAPVLEAVAVEAASYGLPLMRIVLDGGLRAEVALESCCRCKNGEGVALVGRHPQFEALIDRDRRGGQPPPWLSHVLDAALDPFSANVVVALLEVLSRYSEQVLPWSAPYAPRMAVGTDDVTLFLNSYQAALDDGRLAHDSVTDPRWPPRRMPAQLVVAMVRLWGGRPELSKVTASLVHPKFHFETLLLTGEYLASHALVEESRIPGGWDEAVVDTLLAGVTGRVPAVADLWVERMGARSLLSMVGAPGVDVSTEDGDPSWVVDPQAALTGKAAAIEAGIVAAHGRRSLLLQAIHSHDLGAILEAARPASGSGSDPLAAWHGGLTPVWSALRWGNASTALVVLLEATDYDLELAARLGRCYSSGGGTDNDDGRYLSTIASNDLRLVANGMLVANLAAAVGRSLRAMYTGLQPGRGDGGVWGDLPVELVALIAAKDAEREGRELRVSSSDRGSTWRFSDHDLSELSRHGVWWRLAARVLDHFDTQVSGEWEPIASRCLALGASGRVGHVAWPGVDRIYGRHWEALWRDSRIPTAEYM